MNSTRNDLNLFVATMDGDKVKIECNIRFSPVVKAIRGWEWDYTARCWRVPATKETLEMLRGVRQAQIDDSVTQAISGDETDGTPDPIPDDIDGIIARMPVRIRPYDHQAAAFKRCIELFEEERECYLR